jgi:hypothetical protein
MVRVGGRVTLNHTLILTHNLNPTFRVKVRVKARV